IFSNHEREKRVNFRIVRIRSARTHRTTAKLSHRTSLCVANSRRAHHSTVKRLNGRVTMEKVVGLFFAAGATGIAGPAETAGCATMAWATGAAGLGKTISSVRLGPSSAGWSRLNQALIPLSARKSKT